LFFLYSFFFAMLFFLCSWAADFCVRGAAAMLCGRGWRARPEQLQVVTASAAAAQRLTAASPASAHLFYFYIFQIFFTEIYFWF